LRGENGGEERQKTKNKKQKTKYPYPKDENYVKIGVSMILHVSI
jgi:hypothetical protein